MSLLAALGLALAGLFPVQDPPAPALKGLDPVELTRGKEVAGDAKFVVDRAPHRYLFVREENKQAFLVAVETDTDLEHPRCAVIEPVRTFNNASISDWAARRLQPDAEVYTDGLFAFRRFIDAGHAQTVLETGGGRAATEVRGARWVNIVLSNVKRSISGVYHSVRQAKYARRYLGEAAYRFNRRFQLADLLPRLVHAMIQCHPRPEPRLRMASNFLS